MRLINTETLELEEYFNNIPPYAILSHTWGNGEVSFADWKNLDEARKKEGFRKIDLTCKQAAKDGFKYAWVDTNCIDKTSSSELSEAINSMFAWYRDAQVCYVFLRDVNVPKTLQKEKPVKYLSDPTVREAFHASAWFTRGWTLQELLAPSKVIFFSHEWIQLATKEEERRLISDITDIDSDYIKRPEYINTASVARRMSWMAKRKTTRVEDIAYCLLGLFGIHMALLYGEGHRAFLRLQEEIIRVSNDQTIFCWQASVGRSSQHTNSKQLFEDSELYGSSRRDTHRREELEKWTSILAPHPYVFRDSALYFSEFGNSEKIAATQNAVGPYSITNFGLSISLPLLHTAKGACAVLDVGYRRSSNDPVSRVLIPLHQVQNGHYVRLSTQLLVMVIPATLIETRTQIFVDCRNSQSRGAALLLSLLSQRELARPVNMNDVDKNPVIFLTFNRPVDIDRLPLVTTHMDFVPFHSAIEVSNHTPGSQGAIILTGKVARTKSFHLLIGGRSNAAADDSKDLLSDFAVPLDARKPDSSMDWHADIWDQPPPDAAHWNEAALKPLIDRLSTEYFGSWCTSKALKNVLSWRYAPRGALVCYFELDDEVISNQNLNSAGIAQKSSWATPQLEDDTSRFSHLRRSDSEVSSMQTLYSALQSQHEAGLRRAKFDRIAANNVPVSLLTSRDKNTKGISAIVEKGRSTAVTEKAVA